MSPAIRNRAAAGLSAIVVIAAAIGLNTSKNVKPPAKKTFDPWVITTLSPLNHEGTYLGNGYIGIRYGKEGWGWSGRRGFSFFVAGLYHGEARIGLSGGELTFVGDEKFQMDPNLPYRQTLDMRRGFLRSQYSIRSGRDVAEVDITQYVSRSRQGIVLTTIVVRPRRDMRLRVGAVPYQSTALVRDTTSHWLHQSPPSYLSSKFLGMSRDRSVRLAVLGTMDVPREVKAQVSSLPPMLKSGVQYKFIQFLSVAHSGKNGDPARSSLVALSAARNTGAAALVAEHKAAWDKLWAADIKIDGDPEAQQAVHSCMFYVLQSTRKGSQWSVTPTGLSSPAWNGHVFWDADTWIFPALLPQHPELAKTIVDYRFRTLTGARTNARRRGLSGVEFAWESAKTGRETVHKPFSEERHVTADAALAQWQYYMATGDRMWLRRYGYPILTETAWYWTSRVKYNKSADRYEILRVMPPDELAEIVDNSVYTNAAAKRNLELAMKARRTLGRAYPYKWKEVARKMYLPFDKKNRRYVEYVGYKGDRIKQADTELLIYPLEMPMPADVRTNTFDYYKNRLYKNGPAMSSSVHSIIAARLGRRDEAYQLFHKSYRAFLREPFNLFNEKPSRTVENACFVTGAAGTVQAVIYGFGGLRTNSPELSATPMLPKQWKRLAITGIKWRGKTYDLVVEPNSYRLRKVSPAMSIKKAPNMMRKVKSFH